MYLPRHLSSFLTSTSTGGNPILQIRQNRLWCRIYTHSHTFTHALIHTHMHIHIIYTHSHTFTHGLIHTHAHTFTHRLQGTAGMRQAFGLQPPPPFTSPSASPRPPSAPSMGVRAAPSSPGTAHASCACMCVHECACVYEHVCLCPCVCV